MSVIPLLALHLTYWLPTTPVAWDPWAVVAVSTVIAMLGIMIACQLVLPIVSVTQQARQIASAAGSAEAPIASDDELVELQATLDRLNHHLQKNLGQLQRYGDQVKQLNRDIHQRVLALSNLLQVSNVITQGTAVDEVFSYVLEKLLQIEEADVGLVLLSGNHGEEFRVAAIAGTNPQQTSSLQGMVVASPWLARQLQGNQAPAIVEASRCSADASQELQRVFGVSQALVMPMVSQGRCVGFLVLGHNRPHATYSDDLVEVVKIFAKQLAIAMEQDRLAQRNRALTMTDEMTGLYNESYLRTRLEEEVRRAALYHRPCSLVLLNLDNFERVQQDRGALAAEAILKQVARLVLGHLGAVDKVARLRGNEFGLILPERSKREAIQLAEEIRRDLEAAPFTDHAGPLRHPLTVSGGVGENPLDGSTAEELWTTAEMTLRLAKRQGKNRIVTSEGRRTSDAG